MDNIDNYFNELNQDINNAQTRKALKVFSRRAKRLYKGLASNAMTEGIKNYIGKQYKNSMNLIKKVSKNVSI